jgi:hypothetical protein
VRNGEDYVDSFLQHYFQLGCRHIFFLDNGSTDNTIPIAQQHPNVTVYSSDLPINGYQALLKKWLARRATEGQGWCVDADIDEFLAYPYRDVVGMARLLDYLNGNGFTAVITQMLDMFSDQEVPPPAQSGADEDLKHDYEYYDLSDVTRQQYGSAELTHEYGRGNTVSNDRAALFWGGIRKTLYGNNCLLTKHSLFRPSEVELFPHVHFVNNASLADISCVLLHFKLTRAALGTAIQNRDRFSANSATYQRFIDLLQREPAFSVKRETAARLRSIDELVDNFLFVSDAYRAFAQTVVARHTMV